MVETAQTEGPKNWTPAMEQDLGQKALREKVDESIIANTEHKVSSIFGVRDELHVARGTLSKEEEQTKNMVRALGEIVVGKALRFAQTQGERWKQALDTGFTDDLADELKNGIPSILAQSGRVDMARRRVKKLVPSEEYHDQQLWQMGRNARTPEELTKRRQAREDDGLRVGIGRSNVHRETLVSPKSEAAPIQPVHGGFGDGKIHIAYGTPLGRRDINHDWPLSRQDALDISNGDVRWRWAPMVEFYKPSTGATDRRPGYETITYANERGVIVVDPITGHTTDIIPSEAFAATTKKTGGILAMDMINARHSWKENNPVITAMTKDALGAAIAMLGNANKIPGEYRPSDVLVDVNRNVGARRQMLEEKFASLS